MARTKAEEKFTVTKIAPQRYVGVSEAARGLGVDRRAIYMYVGGYVKCIGEKKRARITFVDLTVKK